jgi:hypothetical protein
LRGGARSKERGAKSEEQGEEQGARSEGRSKEQGAKSTGRREEQGARSEEQGEEEGAWGGAKERENSNGKVLFFHDSTFTKVHRGSGEAFKFRGGVG